MKNIQVALFTTGGTIDGADSDLGALQPESAAAKWLNVQPNVEAFIYPLFNKDSREITDADRAGIFAAINECHLTFVVITHGTFTIAQSARVLKAAMGQTNKTILFVGAWKPFGKPDSDAPAQMEFALQELRSGMPGVWIAMDGRLWNPDITEKVEVSPGRFTLAQLGL
jgi:L-asparaginase